MYVSADNHADNANPNLICTYPLLCNYWYMCILACDIHLDYYISTMYSSWSNYTRITSAGNKIIILCESFSSN